MSAFFDEFELEVFESVGVVVVRNLCRTVDDVVEFVDIQELVILYRRECTWTGARLPR